MTTERMEHKSLELVVKNTTDFQVAGTLARLAGFPKESKIYKRSPEYQEASEAIIVFHGDTVQRNAEHALTENPDIIVHAFLEDRYKIEYGSRIDPSLLALIPEEVTGTARNGVTY